MQYIIKTISFGIYNLFNVDLCFPELLRRGAHVSNNICMARMSKAIFG